jgi:hypothetical protein
VGRAAVADRRHTASTRWDESGGLPRLPAVGATTWPDCKDIDHALSIPAVEDHSPLADAQPPQTLGAMQQFDVSLGQRPNGRTDPLPVPPTESAQGLQRGRADLDPPPARISQRSAPLRPQATECQARS